MTKNNGPWAILAGISFGFAVMMTKASVGGTSD